MELSSSSSSSSSSPSTSPRESNAEQKSSPSTTSVDQPKKSEMEVDAEKLLSALQHDRVNDVKAIVDKIKKPIQSHTIMDLQKYAIFLLRDEEIASNLHARFQKGANGEIDEIIYEWLFEWYQTDVRELQLFVLRFVPILISMYLNSTSKRKPASAVLLCIYNNEYKARNDQPLTWRSPSAKDPSKFSSSAVPLQPQQKERRKTVATVGSLNESNLKRLDPQSSVSKEPSIYEHPLPIIQAENLKKEDRDLIVTLALRRFVYFIDSMPNPAIKTFCFACARLNLAGFQKPLTLERRVSVMSLPKGATDSPKEGKKEITDTKKVAELRPIEELEKLKNKDTHRLDIELSDERIPLCIDILQTFVAGITFAVHKAHVEHFAKAALHAINFRANKELLPEVLLTVNSLLHISAKDSFEKHLPWRT